MNNNRSHDEGGREPPGVSGAEAAPANSNSLKGVASVDTARGSSQSTPRLDDAPSRSVSVPLSHLRILLRLANGNCMTSLEAAVVLETQMLLAAAYALPSWDNRSPDFPKDW